MTSPLIRKMQNDSATSQWEHGRITEAAKSLINATGRQLEPEDGLAIVLISALQRQQFAETEIAKIDADIALLRETRGKWVRDLGRCKERIHKARKAIEAAT